MTFISANLLHLPHIVAGQTTRQHAQGASLVPYQQFNLALHVGDTVAAVQHNRMLLLENLMVFGVNRLVWLEQVHGLTVYDADQNLGLEAPAADAVVSSERNIGCVIMTADCLPIVLADELGRVVGCIHAGWRGLLNGVIEATINTMQAKNKNTQPPLVLTAWLGAAIGATEFEVGVEVYHAFTAVDASSGAAFVLQTNGQYLADIYALARLRLQHCGVNNITGGTHCTVLESEQFYSYRAAKPTHQTGRMATVVALINT